ncbi:MAG: murein hydrolase activator EnvC family protein [Chitinophagaceae bacterium]
MLKKLLCFILAVAIAAPAFPQQTKEDIQKKQQELQKELSDLNNTLADIKKNKKQSLGQLALVQRKIKARQELITNTNKQLQNIDADINENILEINRLKQELDTLKDGYAKSLVFAYKNRSNYDYLNFIFSANSFNDAIKRIVYLKSYRQYRETQVDNIVKTQQLLGQKIAALNSNKDVKNNTLQQQGKQLKDLETDKKEQADVVQDLKGQEKDVAAQIKNKEKMRQKLQQNLQVIIRREIAEAKERERQEAIERQKKSAQQNSSSNNISDNNAVAKNSSATNGVSTAPKTNRSYSALETTPEGLTQSLNFENNRGHLPWPVGAGFISTHFGTYEIPGTQLHGTSDGIDISLPTGTTVKSVADGEVSSVFDLGGEQTVVIRHGKYFTTYSHLSSVNVNKGDAVKAGTLLGKAATGDDGDGLVTFMVSNDKGNFLDPESWLRNK